jgi:hypothetical protein
MHDLNKNTHTNATSAYHSAWVVTTGVLRPQRHGYMAIDSSKDAHDEDELNH